MGSQKRPETGPMQFGIDDWRGVFIRGDNAMHMAMVLRDALDDPSRIKRDVIGTRLVLQGLIRTLAGSNQFETGRTPVQMMRPFLECLPEHLIPVSGQDESAGFILEDPAIGDGGDLL